MIERATYDTETRSHCDISRGLDVYVKHHTTQLVCAALETDQWKCAASFIPSCDGRETVEAQMRALGLTVVPPETLVAMLRATKMTVAHNFAFDQGATAALTGLNIPAEQWSCTMSRAMRHGLPGGLGNLCQVLGFGDDGKDKEGNRLMKQLMKPRPTWVKWNSMTPAERLAKVKNRKTATELFGEDALRESEVAPPMWFEDADRIAREVLYCARDVSATARVDKMIPELEPEERAIWLHVHDLNTRGIPLDTQLIQGAIAISEEAIRDVQDRIRTYTGGMIQTLKSTQQLTAWSQRYGYAMDSWAKDSVAAAIADPTCPEPVKVVARARQEASRGSVAKYETASEMVSPDGRLRHQLLYAGTSTLRLAGRGVQPLNLPRPKIEADKSAALADIKAGREIRVPQWKIDYDPERALAAIRAGDLATLRSIGDPEEILSDNIRGMIESPAGKIIVSPDLSAIEARGVFWLTGCEKALEVYRRGGDLYCEFASTVVGHPVNKKDHPELRQNYGKVPILSCFEADTGVLTRDRGVVPIVDITKEDWLWDGIEWVRHEGVVARGKRHTTDFRGVNVTPDHLMMTRRGWRTVADLQRKPLRSATDLAIWSFVGTKPGDGPTAVCATQVEPISGAAVSADGSARRLWKTLRRVARHVAMSAPIGWPPRRKWRITDMPSLCRKTRIDGVGSVVTKQCSRGRFMGRVMRRKTTKIGASLSALSGLAALRFLNGFERSQIGIDPNTASIGLMSTDRTHPSTVAWPPLVNSWETNVAPIGSNIKAVFTALRSFARSFVQDWQRSQSHDLPGPAGPRNDSSHIRVADVFDILECGPRNRFTVVTPQGFYLLVHNCGYGAGVAKVAMTNKIDEEVANRGVTAYRREYHEVPTTWRELERAAIGAIYNPGCMMGACSGKVHFIFEGGWLRIRRPSGTWMYLPDAGVDYEGRLYYHSWVKGGWREESIWGGVIINFVVQGFCRELMYAAEMRLAQDPRIELFLQCYDSLSGLVDQDQAKELCDVMIVEMTTPPSWAPDMPLAAEGKPKMRYS